ncbi:hypothetical protein AXF42_Ash009280 [Apostasia shenzhenica]|uniref:Uncharacterized protein n=1 Tax=Apostasia shenzhenica TaxID=1088818 RepID=A0A2I0B3M1_9ASPA|nr:hypothetical protein AXF42_Ash009280 [Apostasia shenzhenica]
MVSSSLRHCHLRHPSSTAQAGLAKIIFIISTVPPPPAPKSPAPAGFIDSRGISAAPTASYVDLNYRVGPNNEMGEGSAPETNKALTALSISSDPPAPADSGDSTADEKGPSVEIMSSEGECDPEDSEIKEGAKEKSEFTNNSRREEDDQWRLHLGREIGASAGYLDLLLEAVRHVSGNGEEEEEYKPVAAAKSTSRARTTPAARPKRRMTMNSAAQGLDLCEETTPIVQSKRGRILSLPSRYREAVMEPWRKPSAASRRWVGRG